MKKTDARILSVNVLVVEASDKQLPVDLYADVNKMEAFLRSASMNDRAVALLRSGIFGISADALQLLAGSLLGNEVRNSQGQGIIELILDSYADSYAQSGKTYPDTKIEAYGFLEQLENALNVGLKPVSSSALDFAVWAGLEGAVRLLNGLTDRSDFGNAESS